jgi:S-formylglutathione hydrolase
MRRPPLVARGLSAPLALLFVLALACARPLPPAPPLAPGEVVRARVHSDGLAANLLGDPADVEVLVWLPRGYATSGLRYPVLYLLHGFGAGPESFFDQSLQGFSIQAAAPAFIVVAPSGRDRYGGSFWVDSPVTGAWARFLDTDLIAWVDQRFRTLPGPLGRGLAGNSMGGFAALQHGLSRPDLFSAVYALSPCCLEDQLARDLPPAAGASLRTPSDVARAHDLGGLAVAAAAAFSPDPSRPPLFVDLRDRARWTAPLLLANASRLRVIGLESGTGDEFRSIPATVQRLYGSLQEAGGQVQLQEFDGGPADHLGERLSSRVLPFFKGALSSRP